MREKGRERDEGKVRENKKLLQMREDRGKYGKVGTNLIKVAEEEEENLQQIYFNY